MIGTIRFAALLLLLARPAVAQLTTAEVYQRIDMAVQAAFNPGEGGGPGGGASDSFKLPPTTIPVVGSGSDSLPLTALSVRMGGSADVSGFVTWSITPSSITANAQFTAASSATGQDSASAGFDHSFKISYQVDAPTSYRVSGSIRTESDLVGNERLVCASNQTPLAGADPTTIPRATALLFADEGLVYPGETATIECSMIGGSALIDSADQSWQFQVDLTPAPTTSTTIPKRECKQSCKQAKAACRAACPETGKEKRACRKDCKRRAKRCGQSTGCALPAE